MITYIVLGIGVVILLYVTYHSKRGALKKFIIGDGSINLLPNSESEFNKIQNESVREELINRCDEFMDTEQTRDDYNEFIEDVDEIVEDITIEEDGDVRKGDLDSTKIKAYLIENYYNNKY